MPAAGWAAALLLAACGGDAPQRDPVAAALASPDTHVVLRFAYGSEKQFWLDAATARFNDERHTTSDGRTIVVEPLPMGSGESIDEILAGRLQAHLVSPASSVFVRLANARSEAAGERPLLAETRELVLSPAVVAMWKPMAEALGWGKRPIGWADLLQLAADRDGAAGPGQPPWGRFAFGHTHPESSSSGLLALLAEVYAATGTTTGLTLADVERPEVAAYLRDVESSVAPYGSSTGSFGQRLFGGGPELLGAAVLYENLVVESHDRARHRDLPVPLVAIYPKEGTFWSDHPVGVVERPWVLPEHREAAALYVDWLLERPQQVLALQCGFRPAALQVQVTAPVDVAHGVDPNEPKTTLQVPDEDVTNAILALWQRHRKRCEVALVLDGSARMRDALAGARHGAKELLDMLGDDDRLSVVRVGSAPAFVARDVRVGDARDAVRASIDDLTATGGAALYDAIALAHEQLVRAPPEHVTAIVVMTQGTDRDSALSLPDLLERVAPGADGTTVRVFTIAYGGGAARDVLRDLAEHTQAQWYEGGADAMRRVSRAITTFF